MAEASVPPAAAVKRGMGSGIAALLIVIFMTLGFVGGAFLGPRLGIGGGGGGGTTKQNVVVATNTPFPPFESRNVTTNQLEGFDIDLMNEIGARSNWNVIWRDFQDWDTLLAAIQYEGVDLGASSITSSGSVGATRNATMSFSDSYYEADQAVLIKTGTSPFTCTGPSGQCTPDDLANHTVAVQTLTSSYWWIQGELVDMAKTPASMVSSFGDLNQVIQELVNGNVDWVMVDKPIAQKFSQQNNQLTIAGTVETNELYAFATTKDDPGHFLTAINAALSAMKTDGTYDRIKAKWLG